MRTISILVCLICVISCSTDESTQDSEVVEEANLVFDGGVTFNTQEEIEAFSMTGYNVITGDLKILEFPEGAITSLSTLNDLHTIGGTLRIGTFSLENLEGLENVTSIGEVLDLESNLNLITIEHLVGITSSIFSLNISGNISLINLEGLQNITIQSGGFIRLNGNVSLESAASLENSIPENLGSFSLRPFFIPILGGNTIETPLTDLSFLSNVTTIGTFYIDEFQGNTLQGLDNLISCNDSFGIINSPFIEDLSELENLQNVNDFGIGFNPSLTSLDGLDNLISATGDFFSVFGHSQLNDFCALENLFVNGTYSANNYNIIDNVYNPTMQDIIDGNCSN